MSCWRWLGHAGVLLEGSVTIAIDPYEIRHVHEADIVLVTHGHSDHFSPGDISRMLRPGGVLVLPKGLESSMDYETRHVRVGDVIRILGAEVAVEASYNIDKPYHPKSSGGVGYVVALDGMRYYHAGDTDFIPEMKAIAVDVAFLPVGGTYTMDNRQAAEAAQAMKAATVVPIHWGSVVGSEKDAKVFRRRCTKTVIIPEEDKPQCV